MVVLANHVTNFSEETSPSRLVRMFPTRLLRQSIYRKVAESLFEAVSKTSESQRLKKGFSEALSKTPSALLKPQLFTQTRPILDQGSELFEKEKAFETARNYIQRETPSLKSDPSKRSNVLFYQSRNSFILREDFLLLVPKTPSQAQGSQIPYFWNTNSIKVFKARDLQTLRFLDGYYLIFESFSEACLFLCQTSGKMLDDKIATFSFVDSNNAKNCAQELLGEKATVQANKEGEPIIDVIPYLVGAGLEQEAFITKETKVYPRLCYAILHFFPYIFNEKALLSNVLWSFRLGVGPNKIRLLTEDRIARYKLWCVLFENPEEVMRFYRAYHGKTVTTSRVYPKTLVEIIE